MDNNVPPNNTLLVVDALIKANKDFDLMMLPNRSHGFGNEPYMVRRRWDYFVRNLLGAEPPHGLRAVTPATPDDTAAVTSLTRARFGLPGFDVLGSPSVRAARCRCCP